MPYGKSPKPTGYMLGWCSKFCPLRPLATPQVDPNGRFYSHAEPLPKQGQVPMGGHSALSKDFSPLGYNVDPAVLAPRTNATACWCCPSVRGLWGWQEGEGGAG